MDEEEAKTLFNNNFVDLLVDPKWSLNFPFGTFSEDMKGYRRLDFIPRMLNSEDDDGILLEVENASLEKIDVLELSKKLIAETLHNDNIKEKLMTTIKTLYERVQKTKEE